ncbi:hypothetical protein FRC12_008339 [Ceratobasidium sp. 428]|nr:hypothetical protein FRC12_008339 [Ceratobasidium sp. 428]
MSYSHTSPHIPSSSEINITGTRQNAKRPRERSISPHFDNAPGGTQPELESEETLLSFSDLIRPLSTTPSPEPTLHFGTPPPTTGLDTVPSTLSQDDSNRVYTTPGPTEYEDIEDVIDDTKVAEMRRTVIDWRVESGSAGPETGSRERRLVMMIMALTHPARPTASQIAAQAEHIRALLAERSVMVQQLEDLSEFRYADRLGFERTAQALNARVNVRRKPSTPLRDYATNPATHLAYPVQKSANLNGSLVSAIYQDERAQNVELQARNERLHTENVRLERELKDAKREIAELRQSIEGLRVNLLISPRTPATDAQAALQPAMISPTPNPRGRPRKYPLPSPTRTHLFQPPTHSTATTQLPISSVSILNQGSSLATSGQPPPEKRMRPTQPDARAEFLLAAARRVGKDRVVEVLEGPELIGQDDPELSRETETPQPLVYPRPHPSRTSQRELPLISHTDHSAIRRGRPPKASASFPSTAHHHFSQFLVGEAGRPESRCGREMNIGPIRSLHEANSANPQHYPSRHQVVVAFTGDPQADAQACLASFVAQYPGIQPTPTWGTGMGGTRPESGMTGELQTTETVRSAATRTAGTVQRTYSTPELTKNGSRNRGLENLLTAARTVLRARSRSTTPTLRRNLSSSALPSPSRSSPRAKNLRAGSTGRRTGLARRRHSSPAVPLGDSDTEPEESSENQRVYSALDVLADQAAAVRTSSPDLPVEVRTSSPELPSNTIDRLVPVLGSPASLSAFRSAVSGVLPESSPDFSLPPSDFESSPASLGVADSRLRAPSKSPLGGSSLGIPETTVHTGAEAPGDTSSRREEHEGAIGSESMEGNTRQLNTTGQTQSLKSPLRTPPRSEKARGKQRA